MKIFPPLAAVAFALSFVGAGALAAVPPLVLDDFAAPAPADTSLVSQVGDQFADTTFGSFGGVASEVRQATYSLYATNHPGHVIELSIGGGSADVLALDSTAGLGEFVFGYGAFTRPTTDPRVAGPNLGLDLSRYDDFQVVLPAVDKGLNLVVTLYTSAPHLRPDGTPLYYLESGLNLAPAKPGGPLVANLLLDARNPIAAADAPYFNFGKVDGVFFEIDRSGFSGGNRYSLDTLQFTQAVPEPASYALLGAGLLLIGLRRQCNRT